MGLVAKKVVQSEPFLIAFVMGQKLPVHQMSSKYLKTCVILVVHKKTRWTEGQTNLDSFSEYF